MERGVRSCYDILKGCLCGLAVDSWRHSYLMSNLDRMYEETMRLRTELDALTVPRRAIGKTVPGLGGVSTARESHGKEEQENSY